MAQSPAIGVATVIVAEPARETPLPIQVGPPDVVPRQSFVRVRGLPAPVTLTEGHSVNPGVWAVPLQALPALRISAPVGSSGKSELTISLVAIDGATLSEAKTVLVLTTASALVQGQADISPPQPRSVAALGPRGVPPSAAATDPETARPPAAPPTLPPIAAEDKERAQRHMQKGDELIVAGDIAAARLFYQKAAELGWPAGALALAATYDPAELARWKVRGVLPDPAIARRWYEKARELGAAEAAEKLQRLGAR